MGDTAAVPTYDDDRRHSGRCRYCGRRVLWAFTEANGRPMPIELGADPAGNVQLTRDPVGLRAHVLADPALSERRALGAPLHMPHAAVCGETR